MRIADATHRLAAPEDWDEASLGACGDLHARFNDSTGNPVWAVQFMPSEADLQRLLVGDPITIEVVSPFFAPLAIRVGD